MSDMSTALEAASQGTPLRNPSVGNPAMTRELGWIIHLGKKSRAGPFDLESVYSIAKPEHFSDGSSGRLSRSGLPCPPRIRPRSSRITGSVEEPDEKFTAELRYRDRAFSYKREGPAPNNSTRSNKHSINASEPSRNSLRLFRCEIPNP